MALETNILRLAVTTSIFIQSNTYLICKVRIVREVYEPKWAWIHQQILVCLMLFFFSLARCLHWLNDVFEFIFVLRADADKSLLLLKIL